jgi:hypothetical protein
MHPSNPPPEAAALRGARIAGTARGFRHPREVLWQVGRLFPPNAQVEAIVTHAEFPVPPALLWQCLMFYEDVPLQAPWLLRAFLPTPIRTDGGDKRVGKAVECTYSAGSLTKRFTVLDPPHLVRFEVLEQRLGVERCMTTVEGSYEFTATPDGTRAALTTRYRGHLRPRWLWRPFERVLAHRLHRHILDGMRDALADSRPGASDR